MIFFLTTCSNHLKRKPIRFFLVIGLSAWWCFHSIHAQTRSQPNILWIIAEDMSQDQGCYGNPFVKTPTIDKLANEGMRYTHMFTVAGVCAPSRTALATGMYQNALGAMHMRYSEALKPRLPKGVKTIAHILRDAGYQTLCNGKNDYMFQLDALPFDLKDLEHLDRERPFFAKINSHYTHRIFQPDSVHPINPEMIELPPYYPNVKPLRDDWAAYLENIQLLDREIETILNAFKKLDLLENTIIFFFSDHGRPTLKGKYWLYDSGIQIPFIIYIPKGVHSPQGYLPGTVSDQLLSSIDISATTLALAGIGKPPYMHGKIFLGDRKEPQRTYVYGAIDRIGGVYFKTRAIRNKKYKYIRNLNNGLSILECSTEYRKARLPHYNTISILDNYNQLNGIEKTLVTPLPLEELYDLENDPFEIFNLADSSTYVDQKNLLSEKMDDWMQQINDQGLYPDASEIQQHFIEYRKNNREIYRKERLESYLQILNELKQEGKILH